ncbi:poly(A)-specific ribonuclease [Coemansia sp. Benny D115]|nr:poly(A)-specific ribonuclease [Coemansia sp. Benny D115]
MQRGSVVRRITLEPSALVARLDSRNLWLATASGSLVRRDARAGFTVAQSTRAFSSAISDAVFVNDTYAISCGSVVDPQNAYNVVADNTVKVFDMRNLGSTPAETIDCDESATPIKLALAEQSKSTLWVCYDSGYVETRVHGAGSDWTKIGDAYAEPVFNGEYTYTSAFCVAPTAQATIVADTEGILHVWAESSSEIQSTPQLSISGNTCVDVVATAKEKPPIGVNFDDESVSLSCIGGLDILDEPLLSCMDNVCLYDVGRPVNFVDPETTVNLRKIDAVGYMFNPRKTRRNQQVFGRTWRKQWKEGMQSSKDDELTQGRSRFLSQQQRRPQPQLQSQSQSQSQHPHRSSQQQQQQHRQAQLSQTGGSPMAEAAHLPTGISRTALSSSPIQRASTPSGISASISAAASAASAAVAAGGQSSILSSSKTPPKHLQQMRIAYSRFGVEDFDFSLYNSTRFSGLEGGVTNKHPKHIVNNVNDDSGGSSDHLCSNCNSCPWQMVLPREFRLGVSDVEGALGKRIRVLPPKIIADSVAPTKNTDGGDTNATATDGADTSIQTEDGEEGENEDEDESALHTFELVAVVSGIRDTARDREHLVVHVRDPSNPNGWLLFNDFLVQPVPEVSVVSLHDWWRTPSIAIYANSNRSDLTRCISQIVKQHPYKINTRILTSPKSILDRMLPGTSMSPNRRGNNLAKSGTAANTRVSSGQRNSAVPLTRAEAEMLEKGEFICALDAEFVVLEAAKMEVFSDGTQHRYTTDQ